MRTTYPNHLDYNGLTVEEIVEVEVVKVVGEEDEECLVADDGGLH